MLLRRKNKELTAAVDTGDASNGSSTDLAADDIARSLNALADGRFDVTPTGGDPMSEAVRHLTQCLSAQAFGQLRHTVVFSSQAAHRVGHVTGRIGDAASGITEQSAATREVARSIEVIREKTANSLDNARKAVEAVTRSEDIIKEQLTEFQALNLPGAVIEFAKSDHALWKKRLAGMLVGASKLEASELADHHQCRLGKWYDSVSEPAYRNHPAFAALEGPHGRVHKHGRAVAELFARGDRIGALAEYKKMEAASTEVVELLERLSSAP